MVQNGTVVFYKDSIFRGDDWEDRQGNWESPLDIQICNCFFSQAKITLSYFLCLGGQYLRLSTTAQDTDDIYLGYLCDNDFQNLNGVSRLILKLNTISGASQSKKCLVINVVKWTSLSLTPCQNRIRAQCKITDAFFCWYNPKKLVGLFDNASNHLQEIRLSA